LSPDTTELKLDVTGMSARTINEKLKGILEAEQVPERIRIWGGEKKHNLLTAAPPLAITVEGDVGDYCAAATKDADVEILGSAGNGLGHTLQSGVISVRDDVGIAAGAMAAGGLIVVQGNAGARCGAGLQGADIVVQGSVGDYAGVYMQGGTFVILGNVGAKAGYGATSGTWFVLGDIKDSARGLVESRMKEPDKLRLGLLLLNSGLNANAKDFRKYVIEPANPQG
jgi:glutamate synthase domain-containing protein 3